MNSTFNKQQKIVKWLWYSFGFGSFLLLLLLITVRFNLFNFFGEIPSFDELENPKSTKASVIFSEDGKTLGKYFSSENRVRVNYDEISPLVFDALIATEDERFESHSGIDGRSLMRVAKGILTFNKDGGGSTISQQLAKNLFNLRESEKYAGSLSDSKFKMLGIKLKEWITATWLERAYTKNEIITMYLNTVNHGTKANGIHSGAKIYFNKNCKDLNIQEAATLVGTYAANYAYDPIANPERSKTRRNQVFAQMLRSGFIESEEKLKELQALPLKTHYSPDSYNQGIATYFRDAIRDEIESLVDEKYDLTRDGLKIYTTIDYEMQLIAEKSIAKAMEENQNKFDKEWGNKDPFSEEFIKNKVMQTTEYKSLKEEFSNDEDKIWAALKKPRMTRIFTHNGDKDKKMSLVDEVKYYHKMLRAALVAIDHSNGFVKAWVGGLDKKYFDYDMVQKGSRQVGSTFKPILYALAIQNGYEPCSQFDNVSKSIQYEDGRTWEPRVPSWIDGEKIYLKDALKKSLNNIAAQLVDEFGVNEVVEMAERFDINTENLQKNVTMVLGTNDMKMLDIIKPYQTIANLGTYYKHVKITKIEDYQGKVLYEYVPEKKQVMTELAAYKMASMLRGVTEEGTASILSSSYKLVGADNMIGGKTGTTQDSKDCWFIGFTNQIAVATWVGPESYGINYKNSSRWYGGNTALPIFADFLQNCYTSNTGLKKGLFAKPKDLTEEMLKEKILCESDSSETDFELDFH
jgi:penicillin-binding protein 1A